MSRHLETIVQLYVRRDKRERILALAKPSRRADLRSALLHDRRSLDPDVLGSLEGAGPDLVARRFATAGAVGLAYCLFDVDAVDDRELPIAEALELVVGRAQDSLVFAIGSRLAYYENHEGEQYLLQRRP